MNNAFNNLCEVSNSRISEEEAESRIAIQNDNEFFKENADIIIDNTGTIEKLKEQIEKLKL